MRELDAFIVLAATPDVFETVAFPERLRQQTVEAIWCTPPAHAPARVDEGHRPARSRAARAAPTAAAARRIRTDAGAAGTGRLGTKLRDVLSAAALRHLTLLAGLSQWRLVVHQRNREVRLLAKALGTRRARLFRAWHRAAAASTLGRRAAAVAADEATEESKVAAQVARAGTWPRLLGEAQLARRQQRVSERWREVETRAVVRAWATLARRRRVLREWPWMCHHSLVLQRCLRLWQRVAAEPERILVASAAPFMHRSVRP